jgi:hypothetical protein
LRPTIEVFRSFGFKEKDLRTLIGKVLIIRITFKFILN